MFCLLSTFEISHSGLVSTNIHMRNRGVRSLPVKHLSVENLEQCPLSVVDGSGHDAINIARRSGTLTPSRTPPRSPQVAHIPSASPSNVPIFNIAWRGGAPTPTRSPRGAFYVRTPPRSPQAAHTPSASPSPSKAPMLNRQTVRMVAAADGPLLLYPTPQRMFHYQHSVSPVCNCIGTSPQASDAFSLGEEFALSASSSPFSVAFDDEVVIEDAKRNFVREGARRKLVMKQPLSPRIEGVIPGGRDAISPPTLSFEAAGPC